MIDKNSPECSQHSFISNLLEISRQNFSQSQEQTKHTDPIVSWGWSASATYSIGTRRQATGHRFETSWRGRFVNTVGAGLLVSINELAVVFRLTPDLILADRINVFLTLSPESMVNFYFDFCSNYMTPSTDFSSTCWLIAFSCVNMSDLDVSQSVHIDKMKELSKEFADGYNGQLEKLVLGAQDRNLHPFEKICSVADEMLAEGPINWGRIVALYTFVHLFVKSLCKSLRKSHHSYDYILNTKMCVVGELHHYMDLHLRSWITANGGWVS